MWDNQYGEEAPVPLSIWRVNTTMMPRKWGSAQMWGYLFFTFPLYANVILQKTPVSLGGLISYLQHLPNKAWLLVFLSHPGGTQILISLSRGFPHL